MRTLDRLRRILSGALATSWLVAAPALPLCAQPTIVNGTASAFQPVNSPVNSSAATVQFVTPVQAATGPVVQPAFSEPIPVTLPAGPSVGITVLPAEAQSVVPASAATRPAALPRFAPPQETAPPPVADGGRPSLGVTSENVTQVSVPTLLPPLSLTVAAPEEKPTRFPRAEYEPGRRSYVDLSAAPCFAHAEDYNWIIGQVEYSSVAKEWRLRYASVDELDRFGGRVSLIESQQVGMLKDGSYVHVRGRLVNRDSANQGPAFYRVEWFRTVDNPNSVQNPSDR